MFDRIRKMKGEEGFTLVELLVVIVILGILAGVVVFSVAAITDKGAKSACKADVKTVETASEAYYAKNTSYAGSISALKTAGFLHSEPNQTANTGEYWLTYTASNGTVTGTLKTAVNGSTDCTAA